MIVFMLRKWTRWKLYTDLPWLTVGLCVCVSCSAVSDSFNPMDCCPPDSSDHGIVQAKVLEWVGIPFSSGSSRPRDRTQVSCIAGRWFTNWAISEAQFTYESESEVTQSCPTLGTPLDCSLPGSSVHGVFQARVLEWVAISFSNAWKWKVKVKSLSHVRLLATPWTAAYQAPPSMGFSRQECWSGVPLPSPAMSLRES